MMGCTFKTKKELKAHVGEDIRHKIVETSWFGPEYKPTGVFCVVGPNPYNNRKWYAQLTMENNILKKVK